MSVSPRLAAPYQEPTAFGHLRLPFSHCANPHCATGWLHLWRSRRAPVFEGRWACSAGCMAELVRAAVRREADLGSAAPYRHRIPLGLLLVDRGHITPEQLREAVRHQEQGAEDLRLGQWLVESGILSETFLTRALSLQWNCPVFSPGVCRAAEVASALPRFIAEALDALPLRVLGGQTLCLAFSQRIDRALAYAVERILGLRVSCGIVRDSEFSAAHAEFLAAAAPPARLVEISGTGALARLVASLVEAEKPLEARLARVHGFWWLRLWRHAPRDSGLPDCAEVEDILCAPGATLAGLG
jgi:Type II secretion system (T2SS), protein E, N-terminal domain